VIRRATFHRYVAWLALAGMALLMVMPVVSRSMSVDNAMPGMAGMDMDAGCAMNAGHHSQSGVPGYPDDPTAKCGYCTFLAHTPVVGMGGLLLHLSALGPISPPSATVSQAAPFARLLSARPRGPPSRVNA
jgi:hypothetical protein